MGTGRSPHPISTHSAGCPSAHLVPPQLGCWHMEAGPPTRLCINTRREAKAKLPERSNIRLIFTSCSAWAASGLLGLLGPSEQRRTCCPRQPHLLPLCFLADKISVHHSRSMLRRPPQRSTSSAWHVQELRLSLKYLLLFQTTLPFLARLETHLVPSSLADAPCAITAVSSHP